MIFLSKNLNPQSRIQLWVSLRKIKCAVKALACLLASSSFYFAKCWHFVWQCLSLSCVLGQHLTVRRICEVPRRKFASVLGIQQIHRCAKFAQRRATSADVIRRTDVAKGAERILPHRKKALRSAGIRRTRSSRIQKRSKCFFRLSKLSKKNNMKSSCG